MSYKNLLLEFIEWAENCGEDVFYIFDSSQKAVERFLEETYGGNK